VVGRGANAVATSGVVIVGSPRSGSGGASGGDSLAFEGEQRAAATGAGHRGSRRRTADITRQSFTAGLIESRLRPPQTLLELVRRDTLLKRLSASTAPVVVISAPGGFGKTVSLAQWAGAEYLRFTWLQADEADNDPLLFLHYIIAALGDVADVDPQVANWLQLAPPPVQARILPALAAAARGAAPFVFVIDDVHLIAAEACWQIVGLLIEQLPPGAHLCLSGRASPPLPLARLRATGRLLELGPADLALSLREIHELLRLHGVQADDDTVASLERVTEGWAAGLYLAALAGPRLPSEEWLAGIRGDQREIADYLANEVLEQQPLDVAEFLLQTSILERLSPSLCRAVTGNEKAGNLLSAIAHNNLFVSALDDVDEWFRYHHLFAEFLQRELLRLNEAGAAGLHQRAAAWFEEHDQPEEAVRHWLAAGEPGPAGAIVCRSHMHYAHLARYETTRRWLDTFTDEPWPPAG
jgi:LuxR family maltose regulon positive regulatory protein